MYEQLVKKLQFLATAEDATGMHDSALAMREAAKALAAVEQKAVAQGGGVDVERVMALVEEIEAVVNAYSVSPRAAEIRAQIRALLTAAPAIANQRVQK